MAKYSFSQIWSYVQCPKKYQFKYVDKMPDEFRDSPDTILWSAVHHALEFLYNQVNINIVPTKEEILKEYKNYWDGKIAELNDKWIQLEYRKETTQKTYLERWEVYIKKYCEKNTPFSDVTVIGTELNLMFLIDEDNGINFSGFIDRLDKVWDTFIINDYKTNKSLPTEENDEYRDQLTLYAIWVKQKYGKYLKKIVARLHFLHFDIVDEREITDELLEETQKKYKDLANEIDDCKSKYAKKESQKIFEPKQSPLCNWCSFQSICPLFVHMNMPDEVAGDLSTKTIRTLVDEFCNFAGQESDAKKQKEWIKKILLDYIQNNNEEIRVLFWNNYKLSISEWVNYKITDQEILSKLLEDRNLLEKVLWIDRFKLKKQIVDNDLEEDLWDSVEKSVSYTFRKSTNKK